jgi:hypothetical protein
MAMQMRDMAAASRDLEKNKIDVQLKLFLEQMEYQREKDRRLYETSVIANENAPLVEFEASMTSGMTLFSVIADTNDCYRD